MKILKASPWKSVVLRPHTAIISASILAARAGLSDERSSRTSARSSSLMDSDISSSMSSTRRMMRTTSYGDDGGGSYSSTTVRRSSRLSALDDDDIGSSARMQSSSVRTSRLSSRNDDDFGSSAITRRALAISSGDSFESSRKSSLTSSLLGESVDSSASRALRRLSKDDDKESFTSKRSKLASKSSFDVDESSASVRYSSTKISSTIESSDLGGRQLHGQQEQLQLQGLGWLGHGTGSWGKRSLFVALAARFHQAHPRASQLT
ncbi:hypothetical protein MTO96_013231 [Rhipicephalus appendiculatus]